MAQSASSLLLLPAPQTWQLGFFGLFVSCPEFAPTAQACSYFQCRTASLYLLLEETCVQVQALQHGGPACLSMTFVRTAAERRPWVLTSFTPCLGAAASGGPGAGWPLAAAGGWQVGLSSLSCSMSHRFVHDLHVTTVT